MICYKMGSSPAGVYTLAKTLSDEEPQAWMKNGMTANIATLFARGVL